MEKEKGALQLMHRDMRNKMINFDTNKLKRCIFVFEP